MRYLALLFVIGLAACANDHDLPTATGPVFQLNPGKWTATEADLRVPPERLP